MKSEPILLFIISLCLVLPIGRLAAQDGTPAAPTAAESEPNDTLATADPVTIGDTTAAITPVGDVDNFRLSLSAGQRVYLAALVDSEYVLLELALYDAGGAPIDSAIYYWLGNEVVLSFVAPTTANYYVRVASDGDSWDPDELTGNYILLVRNVPADEPADPLTPVEAAWGSVIDSTLFAPWDFDWFVVHGRPGDVFHVSLTMDPLLYDEGWLYIHDVDDTYPYWSQATLRDAGTDDITFVVPFESDYIIRVHHGWIGERAATLAAQPYRLTIERQSLTVAFSRPGYVAGEPFGMNDILAKDADGEWWLKLFDGEDVGATAPLGGFEFMPDGSLLLAFNKSTTLPGLGAVKPQDIVRFVATSWGNHTAGAFSFYLRGAQAGLTTDGERIDAIALEDDGSLTISAFGSGAVPKQDGGMLAFRDEDVLRFYPSGPMPSAGAWAMEFDGSANLTNFGAQDVRALTFVDDYNEISGTRTYHYMTFLMATDRSYSYTPFSNEFNRATAKPGDLMLTNFDPYDNYSPADVLMPLTKTTLGLQRIISSVSIGPDWDD